MTASDLRLKTEYRRVEDLIPNARNARTHSDEQIAIIASSIRHFGFLNPILVDGDRGVIAGHGRLMAARKLKMVEVPCIELAHLTDADKRAYIIADNSIALRAGWNEELLRLELGELDGLGFDLDLLGFQAPELERLLAAQPGDGLTDPEDAPEIPTNPVSVVGDVWVLGKHRLVCGDCTDKAAVAACLNGVTPGLMITDPPYGVTYDPQWRNDRQENLGGGKRKRALGTVDNDANADWREAWTLFPGDVAYVWHAALQSVDAAQSLISAGFKIRAQIIWSKPHFAVGRGDYHWQHEPCWYVVREGKTGHWNGDRTQSTIWSIEPRIGWMVSRKGAEDPFTGHSTQKPVEAMQRPIENNTNAGQSVYDPFVGSGTTLIAAERTGRACYALELNPAYVDVALLRWQSFTGQNAVLEGSDGKTFTQIVGERQPGNVVKLGKPLDEKSPSKGRRRA